MFQRCRQLVASRSRGEPPLAMTREGGNTVNAVSRHNELNRAPARSKFIDPLTILVTIVTPGAVHGQAAG